MRSVNSADSVSDIPRPVLGIYTPEIPCHSINQQRRCPAILWFGQMPAFQQLSGTLRSCSTTSLSTWMYKQHDSCLGFSPGEVGDPPGPPAQSLGGPAMAVSSIPDWRSEGSRSPAAWASTGATCAIPSFESISAFNGSLHSCRFNRASNGNVTKPSGQSDCRHSLTKIFIILPLTGQPVSNETV